MNVPATLPAEKQALLTRLVDDLARILAHPGETAAELSRTVTELEAVWQSVVALTGGTYRPRFDL